MKFSFLKIISLVFCFVFFVETAFSQPSDFKSFSCLFGAGVEGPGCTHGIKLEQQSNGMYNLTHINYLAANENTSYSGLSCKESNGNIVCSRPGVKNCIRFRHEPWAEEVTMIRVSLSVPDCGEGIRAYDGHNISYIPSNKCEFKP